MSIEIRNKRNELYKKSTKLQSLAIDKNNKKSYEVRKKHDEVYNKWKFYDGFIKAQESNNGN